MYKTKGQSEFILYINTYIGKHKAQSYLPKRLQWFQIMNYLIIIVASLEFSNHTKHGLTHHSQRHTDTPVTVTFHYYDPNTTASSGKHSLLSV